jgi:hypothetical protein
MKIFATPDELDSTEIAPAGQARPGERPFYIPPRHEPLDEPQPVNAPPRMTETPIRPSKWDATLNRLKRHPGQWFIVCEYSGAGTPPTHLRVMAERRGFAIQMVERVGGPARNRSTRVYARRIVEVTDGAA